MSLPRLSARLGQLPHSVLAELAARLCSESAALQAAEACMAAHNPLQHEMVERVLLSRDLVPYILGPLETADGAAAAVCSQWLTGWKATNEPRRRLKQVPFDFAHIMRPTLVPTSSASAGEALQMAATPDGRLVVRAGKSEVLILDRSMRVLQTVMRVMPAGCLFAANDDSIFSCSYHGVQAPPVLYRCTYDGTVAAEFQLEAFDFSSPVLAPGGLLFCVINEEEPGRDEIIALDAQTLQIRHRFGVGLLDGARQLVVVGDELYVCDTCNNRLQVFSLTGEHRRSVMGEWKSPHRLCVAKDRLYLVERDDWLAEDGNRDTARAAALLRGRRLLVLSLQGDILQIVTHPTEPTAQFQSICCFEGKLLASYQCESTTDNGGWRAAYRVACGVLTFQGL